MTSLLNLCRKRERFSARVCDDVPREPIRYKLKFLISSSAAFIFGHCVIAGPFSLVVVFSTLPNQMHIVLHFYAQCKCSLLAQWLHAPFARSQSTVWSSSAKTQNDPFRLRFLRVVRTLAAIQSARGTTKADSNRTMIATTLTVQHAVRMRAHTQWICGMNTHPNSTTVHDSMFIGETHTSYWCACLLWPKENGIRRETENRTCVHASLRMLGKEKERNYRESTETNGVVAIATERAYEQVGTRTSRRSVHGNANRTKH